MDRLEEALKKMSIVNEENELLKAQDVIKGTMFVMKKTIDPVLKKLQDAGLFRKGKPRVDLKPYNGGYELKNDLYVDSRNNQLSDDLVDLADRFVSSALQVVISTRTNDPDQFNQLMLKGKPLIDGLKIPQAKDRHATRFEIIAKTKKELKDAMKNLEKEQLQVINDWNMILTKALKKTEQKEGLNRLSELLEEAAIDTKKVTAAAMSIAKKVFGDKTDKKKVDGMVKKAISMAKDTEDAIGIVQGFFQEK